jgi:hypothetical protein
MNLDVNDIDVKLKNDTSSDWDTESESKRNSPEIDKKNAVPIKPKPRFRYVNWKNVN